MIGIIGYRNHSLKILNILIKLIYKNITVYCRDKKNLSSEQKGVNCTSDLKILNDCKIIFITSPSNTHVFYIKKFLNKRGYIFCEKPAATTIKEINYLNKIKSIEKGYIYFNFKYLNSSVYKLLDKELNNIKNGKLMHVSMYASHGLFFNKNYTKNWRIQNKNIFDNITGNLGIHYLNLLINIFGKINKINIFKSNFSNKGNDTSLITLQSSSGETASIFLSYATVCTKEIKFFFTNAIIEILDNKIYKYAPRDTFNNEGSYVKPKKILISKNGDLSLNSLNSSVKYFMKTSISKNRFSIDQFNNALLSSQILLKK